MTEILKDSNNRKVEPLEKSTLKVSVSFTDEEGTSVAPDTLEWTLTNSTGTVINSREDVTITTPESTEVIMLTGDDLSIVDGGDLARHLTLNGTYDSTNQNDLSLTVLITFKVRPLVAVS